MKEKRQILGKQYFRAQFDKESIDVDKRTVDVVFATERQVCMYNWDIGLFYEVLPCNDLNGDISRLNSGAPLCDTHDTSSVRSGLGVVSKGWFDNGVGRATVRFSKRADVEPVWQDVQDGIITGVSVGYNVYEYEEVGVKDNLPLVRANKWEATEISLALVQADIDSAIGRAKGNEDKHEITFISNNKNSNTMTAEEKAALKAERTRSAQIVKLCRAANVSAEFEQELIESEFTLEECRAKITDESKKPAPVNATEVAKQERSRIAEIRKAVRVAGLEETFADPLIDGGITLDLARAQIIDAAHTKNPVTPKVQSGVTVAADEADKKVRGMESSILQRSGLVKPEVAGEPGEFRGATLMDIAKECLRTANIEVRGLTQMQIATRALQMTRDGGGGLATGDFAYILQNVLNKTLRAMYDLQTRTFTPWSRKSTASDFKNMLRTQLSDVKLSQVREGGEYSFATLADSGETYKVAKYGKIVNIDWETVVNDDLNAFSRVPTLLAGAVAQLQGDLMYALLTASQVMGDGNQLFDATNHVNYTSAGTAISVASLGVARKLFRQQKSPGGNVLNLAPKFLIVGPQQEMAALQFTSQNYVATKNADINVWVGMLQVIVDARITDLSWYLAADPMIIDTAEYATLEGQDIYSETRYGFDVDALQYKVRSVFGCKAIDWRSFYKNAGA